MTEPLAEDIALYLVSLAAPLPPELVPAFDARMRKFQSTVLSPGTWLLLIRGTQIPDAGMLADAVIEDLPEEHISIMVAELEGNVATFGAPPQVEALLEAAMASVDVERSFDAGEGDQDDA